MAAKQCTAQKLAWLLLISYVPVDEAVSGILNFTVYSAPVNLRYGEVFNSLQSPMKLPPHVVARYAAGDKAMAIAGFDVDMVRITPDGREYKVKLEDHYLHHYALNVGRAQNMEHMLGIADRDPVFARSLTGCHAMSRSGLHAFTTQLQKNLNEPHRVGMFGSASGAEYRDNPQRFDMPFRMLLWQPEVWAPLIHIINTNQGQNLSGTTDLSWSPLIECPCTPQRKINVSAGTIDGHLPSPQIHCSPEFAATGNPSCHLSTYAGGWRCCEHRMFVIDTAKECARYDCSEKPMDEVFMKFTFFYEDAESQMRGIEPAACCDVTSTTQGNENIEYDIPACAPGTHLDDCMHVAESVQPLAYFGNHPKSPHDLHKASDLVDLVFAAPHLHLAGISLELVDHITNKSLCEVHSTGGNKGGVKYGHGSAPGDEKGYLVGLSTCRWNGTNAPRFRRDHPMRMRAVYNSSLAHTGVMSLWLMDVSAVEEPDFVV